MPAQLLHHSPKGSHMFQQLLHLRRLITKVCLVALLATFGWHALSQCLAQSEILSGDCQSIDPCAAGIGFCTVHFDGTTCKAYNCSSTAPAVTVCQSKASAATPCNVSGATVTITCTGCNEWTCHVTANGSCDTVVAPNGASCRCLAGAGTPTGSIKRRNNCS